MSALSIQVPFPVFQDRDGQPLDNGYVWLGTSSLNPQTNPIACYYDAALTIAATQPLRTINGFISRAGSPAQVYVDAVNFSVLVQDRQGTTVFSVPEGTGISPNASGVVYDPAGTGAVATTVQAKLRESVSVKDFGAAGDGVTNCSIAFTNAMAASSSVYVPPGSYLIDSALSIPGNCTLFADSRQSTTLLKGFNGDMIQMRSGAALVGMSIDGRGTIYTGQGLVFNGTDGQQIVKDARVTNFSAACLYFFEGAGSQCSVHNLITSQTSGGTGSGNYAIVIKDTGTAFAGAVPRKFTQIETNGSCSFFFGSSNNTYISNSFLGDLFYSLNSRASLITSCRIANQAALTIQGNNHTLVGCDINPQITIASGSDNIAIQGNSYNNLPIINNSNNARNLFDTWVLAYTPALTSGGTPPTIGNGSIIGSYSRQGATTWINGQLTLGSTTSLGTGGLDISLPSKRHSGDIFVGGSVVMNRGGVIYTGVLQIAGSVTTASLLRDTTGSITFNSPGVFATGDTIRWSAIYSN